MPFLSHAGEATSSETTEFRSRLVSEGHTPPGTGCRRGRCACSPKKSPSLSVGPGLVFYCHRCAAKGNLQTLRRSQGLQTARPVKTPEQRRQALLSRQLAHRVGSWSKRQRSNLIHAFQSVYDLELWLRDRGMALIEKGEVIDDQLFDAVLAIRDQRDVAEARLQDFDMLSAEQLIAEFRAQGGLAA
jgi:hypothetical protein